MLRKIAEILFLATVILVIACSGPRVEVDDPQAVPYEFVIERVGSPEPGLAEKFNKYIVREDFYTVAKVDRGYRFPQLFPNVLILTAEFEDGSPQVRSLVAYDTTTGRFYPITNTESGFIAGYNDLLSDKFDSPLTEKDAYYIAASLAVLKFHCRALALRKEDLFLAQRLRSYINDTFQAKPGKPQDVFNRDWWGWQAFPLVNNHYRTFFTAYKDSLAEAEFLRDVPPDVVGPPEVWKDGKDIYVKILGLPPGRTRKVVRYDFRISEDGQIIDMASADAYIY